jgi:hypothetical protein
MKYHNKVTYIDGILFDSKREATYFLYLRDLEKRGTIKNLQLQTKMPFKIDGKTIFTYKPDFEYDDAFGHHIIDVKGVETTVFRLKKKLIQAQYKCEIEIVK